PGAEGEAERTSAVRALYLTLAMAVPLPWLIDSAIGLLRWCFETLFSASSGVGSTEQHGTEIALLLVTGAVIAYHASIRRRDTRVGPLDDEAAWLPRLYVYVAAFTGAMLLLFGLADLLRVLNDALFGAGAVAFERRWWAGPLSNATARSLVGLGLWGLSWAYALRTLARADWLGVSERRSALRWFYVYAIVFVSVLLTLRGVSSSLNALLRLILDVPRPARQPSWTSAMLEPLLVAMPFAGFWVYHRFVVLDGVPDEASAPLGPSLRRLYTYLVALVGLAFTGVGSAWVLGILIDLLFGGSRTVSVSSTFWRTDVARFGSFALVGAAAWLWQWKAAEQRVAEDEASERGATTRRIYLYATLAASLVAILVSLAVVIYRLISAILGVHAGANLTSSLSTALGVVIVAGALLAYHFVVLRRDLAQREESGTDALTVTLLLIAPADADIDATVSQLRAQLPEGFALERAGTARRRLRLPAAVHDTPGDDPQAPVVGVP
ncbi:MAG TPA: DUF5671 domain-containing protein, partial [Nitrolancea sp.]|nr:DUF5671 domain-containing protein [Nitrolancea sp.]